MRFVRRALLAARYTILFRTGSSSPVLGVSSLMRVITQELSLFAQVQLRSVAGQPVFPKALDNPRTSGREMLGEAGNA